MTIRKLFCLLSLSVCILANFIECTRSQASVSIHPADQTYWSDSRIQLSCKTYNNIQADGCIWSLNGKRITANDTSYYINLHSCSISVKSASSAVSGEWKCVLFPTGDGQPSMSASTRITILRITLREFILIFTGLIIIMAFLIIIALLLLKMRRLSESLKALSDRRLGYLPPSTRQSTDGCASCTGTPPPSYNAAVGERILVGECARLEFARFLNEFHASPEMTLRRESGINE